MLLVDPKERLLLFHFTPADRPPLWATAGGECDPGEDYAAPARRELNEETGIDTDPGPCIATRESDFTTFAGEPVHAAEHYFLVRTAARAISDKGHTASERAVMRSHRWWTLAEIAASEAIIYPPDLADLFGGALAGVDQGVSA